jgi:hypothetical protein
MPRMRGMLERKAERLARVAGAPEGTATVVPGAVDPSVTRSV